MPKANGNRHADPPLRKPKPAMTPEARESQLIALAVDRVEQRLVDGTASSQEIIHFLRLGSTKAELELEKLRKENELLRAKTEAIDAEKESAAMFAQAIAAMKSYRPVDLDEEE